MKKINLVLCVLIACLLTACEDTCGFPDGQPNTTYEWSYTKDGTTSSGTFTTNQYGQGSFNVPEGTDCSKVDFKVKGGVSIAPEAPPIN
jgi:hypothetical protein